MDNNEKGVLSKSPGMRSTKGCWTCRLRRKKCDETHPFCQTCASLQIHCHGYGPRPSWMDRGPLERREAHKVKMTIARDGQKRKRQSSMSGIAPVSPPGSQSTKLETYGSALQAGTDSLTETRRPMQIPLQDALEDGTVSPPFSLRDEQKDLVLRHVHGHSSSGGTIEWSADDFIPSPQNSVFAFDQGLESTSTALLYQPPDDLGSCGPVDCNIYVNTALDGIDPTLVPFDTANVTSPWSSTVVLPAQQLESGTGPVSINTALLLSRYMKRILPAQFALYNDTKEETDEWFLALLLSSRPLQEISAIMARAHQSLEAQTFTLGHENLYGDQTSWTSRLLSSTNIFSRLDESLKISQSILTCTYLCQTIWLEVMTGSWSQWEACLDQAATYVEVLIDLSHKTTAKGNSSAMDHKSFLDGSMQSTYITAGKALLSQLAWLDIIANVSSGRLESYIGVDYDYLFAENLIDIRQVCGCPNWVAQGLHEILSLRRWKSLAEERGKLSVIELANRGGTILRLLTRNMKLADEEEIRHKKDKYSHQGLHRGPNAHAFPCSSDCAECNRDIRHDMTMVFARAAIVYLHVVVSGPNPHIEELQIELDKLTGLLQALATRGMMRYAPWPLCVTLCFAGSEQRELLKRDLNCDAEAGSQRKYFKTCDDAVEVAEVCHRSREEERRNSDWTTAMHRLHRKMLLC